MCIEKVNSELSFTITIYFGHNNPTEAVLTCTHNLCIEQKYEKYYNFSSKNYHFL